MVIGQNDCGLVAHGITEGPTKLVVFAQVIEDGRTGLVADDTETAMRFVDLITREEGDIGIHIDDVLGHGFVGETVVVLAGEGGHPQWSSDGICADDTRPFVRCFGIVGVVFVVDQFVGRIYRFVPVGDPEGRDPGVAVELGFPEAFPSTVAFDEEFHVVIVFFAHGASQRADLHHETLRAA